MEHRAREGGSQPPRRFVLLDRDGVLNVEKHYLSRAEDVELLPGVVEGLQRLRALGLGLVVVTNQSGIGRGYFDLSCLEAVHARLRQLLRDGGVDVDAIYHCPHAPEARCGCRKPAPGLAWQAAADLGFAPAQTFVIGDKASDLELARALGAPAILVAQGYGNQTLQEGRVSPDLVAADLVAAARWIEERLSADYLAPRALGA